MGVEEVAAPAGTFLEAIRVDSRGQINMASFFGENNTSLSSFNFDTAPGTWKGLVWLNPPVKFQVLIPASR
jgi:hypothetical protein